MKSSCWFCGHESDDRHFERMAENKLIVVLCVDRQGCLLRKFGQTKVIPDKESS